MITRQSAGVRHVNKRVTANLAAALSALLALAMTGCATTKDNTLASLGDELPVKIETDAVISSARDKAMENYWEFMNSAPKDSLRVEAMRRLADLEVVPHFLGMWG